MPLFVACATSPPPPAAAVVTAHAPPPPSAEPAYEEEPVEQPPTSWAEAVERYGDRCPAPFFTLTTTGTRTIGGTTFTIHGSRIERVGDRVDTFTIGVLGATKDATPETLANLRRAEREFRRAHVDVVLVNGDLVGGTLDGVDGVVDMLGTVFALPVLVHSGNSEWMTRYNEALHAAESKWPQIVNLNFVREVDWSGIHLVSLPGYFNRRFLREGACHYGDDDVEALGEWVTPYVEAGQPVILTSHGPPLGEGAHALDVIHEGANVGDPALTTLLDDNEIPFGIFSHILESGGRALDAPQAETAVALPMKTPSPRLYVNVGASTAFAWGMLDGKTSRGQAAIFRVERHADGTSAAKVTFLPLR